VATLRAHVDDTKESFHLRKQSEMHIEDLHHIYGEITVHSNTEHDYLGMVMQYNKDNQSVTINMHRYISGCIKDFKQASPETILKDVSTLATDNLSNI
jgi:hypothetical protein